MADQKISELTTAVPTDDDYIPFVDLSDNTTKKATKANLKGATGDTGPQGDPGMVWEGPWLTATAYAVDDVVSNGGSSYICIEAHTSGTFATDLAAAKWQLVAQKGDTGATGPQGPQGEAGAGSGDMLAATYDPQAIAGDAFDTDNHTDGTTNKVFTATEKTKLAGIEAGADITDAGNVGSSIHGATEKATPVDADTVALIDSAASNALKKLSWTNIKATLKTYFDTLYAPVGGGGGSAVISFGLDGSFNSNITRYVINGQVAGQTAENYYIVVPKAGTLQNLYAIVKTNTVNAGATFSFTVMVNGVASALTCTIGDSGAVSASDTTNTVALSAGDKLTFRLITASITSGAYGYPCAAFEIA